MVICAQLIFFTYRFDATSSIINTQGHDFRFFITHVDCNVNKYSFFIDTALMCNSLPSAAILARNTKFVKHL